MDHIFCVIVIAIGIILLLCEGNNANEMRRFPEDLMFGTATASYQVEGAWNVDGKSESIWDYLTHNGGNLVADGSNGDIAANSYYLYPRDIQMAQELGLSFYRFSLSWPRIFPNGFSNQINKAGVNHYNNMINELLKNNIQPVVTLYHWDLPQKLQDLGGWTNPYIINWYSDYARVAFRLFGDRVKYWITVNQPHHICYNGYGSKLMAPAVDIKGIAEYICMKNVLLAHATGFHIYDEEFRSIQNGNIFISLSAQWYEPATKNDIEAARDANLFYWEIYAHAIFSKTGDFPDIIKKRLAAKSTAQGFSKSRLPILSPNEIKYIRGSADYLGINHYSTFYVYRNKSVCKNFESPSFLDDLGVQLYQLPEWQIGESNFTMVVPWGFYKLLTRIREAYNNPTVFISENGFASHGGLDDTDRVTYYKEYMSALLDSIDDGSKIKAYAAWSLMDNFEWLHGYGHYWSSAGHKPLSMNAKMADLLLLEFIPDDVFFSPSDGCNIDWIGEIIIIKEHVKNLDFTKWTTEVLIAREHHENLPISSDTQ